MRTSTGGRDELAGRVQRALSLPTKKEAEHVVNAVIGSLETTLLNHLGSDGFTLKLNPIRVSTEAEWGDYLADLDQEYAYRMFAGRTNQECFLISVET